MARIFLSHSSGNNAEAIALRDWLISQGWDDLFLDLDPERGLKAGERWQAALKQAAERCELVILLVSPEWTESKWCLAEFLLAKNLNKRIFGVIVEPTPLSDLPTEMTAEWQLLDLVAGTRDHKVTVTAPGSDKATTVAFAEESLERLRIGLTQAGLEARYFAWPPEDDPNRAPYRGLEPLEAKDAGIFFGRDGSTVIGLDLLRGLREAGSPRLLFILGASGAGKSSFLRAGLLPRLERESQHFLPLRVIRPERAALSGEAGLIASLEKALMETGHGRSRALIRKVTESGPSSIALLLEELLDEKTSCHISQEYERPKPPTLILAVDQAEELFLAEGAAEAGAFLDILSELVKRDSPAIIALFTVRSDSFERLQSAEHLQGLRPHLLSLPPMPRGAYAEVINGPARRLEGTKRALKIEEPLVDALLADIEEGGAKDALPLLAFTLERLYREHGGDGNLSLTDYEELGRIRGSIEAAIERALKSADDDPKIPRDRQVCLALLRRGLIPWLAGVDSETGSPRRRIARRSEIPAESRPLIDLLLEQRLLATDVSKATGEVTIEPVHEALLSHWGLLKGWLAEDAGLLGVLEGVKRASRDWAANNKDTGWLMHLGERLKTAGQLTKRSDLAANLEPTDLDYLATCHNVERTAASRKRRAQVLVGGLVVLLVAVGVGWFKQDYLKERYYWYAFMSPAVLTAAEGRALKPGDEFKECSHCPAMLVLPAGKFMMGRPDGGDDNSPNPHPIESQRPQHDVRIPKPFAVSKFEVTYEEWQVCVAYGDCDARFSNPGEAIGHHPVHNVKWDDARRYVAWLSRMTGKTYRLLSEAEWEYAARAGTQTVYSWGDEVGKGNAHCDGCGGRGPAGWTTQVGHHAPNAFGLYDMHGNALEWVEDCVHNSYEDAPADGSAWTRSGCKSHVLRGGAWYHVPKLLGSAERFWSFTHLERDGGIRVAKTLHLE